MNELKLSNRKYLVTGGAGFIGSHLVQKLLELGGRVTVLDDLSTGTWKNIAALENHPEFRAIIASADDKSLMEQEISQHDFVFHLASAVGVKLVVDHPIETVRRIVRTTETIVDACARFRRPMLLTSTSEVYGKSEKIPFKEEDDVVIGPTFKRRWTYATAKALDEFYVLGHYFETSLPVRIVRLFNTVGARQTGQYGMVLPRFVESALKNETLYVYGNGTQRRCFCSVHDIVSGLIRVSESPETIGNVVNLGTNEEISIADLAQKVIQTIHSQSKIEFLSYDEAYGPGFDDMTRRIPCLDRAKKWIHWSPQHHLDDIIEEIVEEKRKNFSVT